MSSIIRGAKKAGGALKNKFFPDRVAEDAGVKFLNRGGFLRERFDRIEGFTDRTIIDKESEYLLTTLPWLNIRKNSDHFKRNDYMNDMDEYYQELSEWIDHLKSERLIEENNIIKEKRIELLKEGKQESELPPLLKLEDIPCPDPDLEAHKQRIERYLGWGGDTLLGLSFNDPDDNKSIVMRIPVVLEAGKTRYIDKGGGPGGDVKEIPE